MDSQCESSTVRLLQQRRVAAEMADRVAVMYAGRVVETGPVADVFNQPWHPYTWGLLASIPPLTGPRQGRLYSIPGMPPAPGTRLPGCAYVARCPAAMAVCHTPPPEQVDGAHRAFCFLDASQRAAARQKVGALT
jgi:peptide/nickel transport system ATP-binding protein